MEYNEAKMSGHMNNNQSYNVSGGFLGIKNNYSISLTPLDSLYMLCRPNKTLGLYGTTILVMFKYQHILLLGFCESYG